MVVCFCFFSIRNCGAVNQMETKIAVVNFCYAFIEDAYNPGVVK